jgi:hypothetical protein
MCASDYQYEYNKIKAVMELYLVLYYYRYTSDGGVRGSFPFSLFVVHISRLHFLWLISSGIFGEGKKELSPVAPFFLLSFFLGSILSLILLNRFEFTTVVAVALVL